MASTGVNLPPFPHSASKRSCGICGGQKIKGRLDVMQCPHCDDVCRPSQFVKGPCSVCEGGYKGLGDIKR